MGVAADERQALSALLDQVGPDAPTLCEGWQTRDLAAHLVLREHRPDAAAGIMVPPLAGHTRRVQDQYAAKPWSELVEQVRSGPAWFWPTRIGAVDEAANGAEFLVHHEDVRRGQPGWEPRAADPARDAAAWRSVKAVSKLNLRKSPVGVVLRTPDGRQATVKAGPDVVTVVGAPVELLLFVFGRDAVRVEFEGDAAAIGQLRELSRGI
ncbi:TIGR03085 family metal-binding protein [Amycolatopsis acidiphila]|uniref:TIGR03085 family protein n=1 Tax=Amycolatopsis acidiphila TaxID=715473 RepID=A0A558AJX5_9PSEU|nr:TIGR03085 family metal-binding protein [Amycolatopsis acidiphila]TVT24560.1 TIGR03085 family protein [Amycolatopsis acidiphila]UIJ58504.1 TIGR03085 family metal-binding protein [Amycolatopsis acidiphila]GHG77126.1 TIGR03085 family protein [Amycolatopsis acidiphila]